MNGALILVIVLVALVAIFLAYKVFSVRKKHFDDYVKKKEYKVVTKISLSKHGDIPPPPLPPATRVIKGDKLIPTKPTYPNRKYNYSERYDDSNKPSRSSCYDENSTRSGYSSSDSSGGSSSSSDSSSCSSSDSSSSSSSCD